MAIVFLDLDGTSLHRGMVAKGVKEAVDLLKKNNHIVAIATGRSPLLLEGNDEKLGIDYLVLANGSYVSHKGEIIHTNYISNETVKEMMNYVDENKIDLVVEYLDRYVAYRKDTSTPDDFSDIFSIPRPVYDPNFYPEENVFAMVVFKTAENHISIMEEKFPNLKFSLSNEVGYDVNIKGDLKAEGVKALVKHLNYSEDEVYAIGDGQNDITMLKAVKHGIAMGNASDEVKQFAEYVTSDVNDFGVYNALKHYKLI